MSMPVIPPPSSRAERSDPGQRDASERGAYGSLRSARRDEARAGLADECRQQSRVVAAANAADLDLDQLLDTALADLDAMDDSHREQS